MNELTNSQPTSESARIESLDVVRGFALLGIFAVNIIAFALPMHYLFVPVFAYSGGPDAAAWVVMELGFEGAMRCLFSILFGAGVALFLSGGRGAKAHYVRNFWLLVFGLVDAYLFLWLGDILFLYALVGFVLYFVRDVRPSRLITTALVLIGLMSLQYWAMGFGLSQAEQAAERVAQMQAAGETPSPQLQEGANAWHEFVKETVPSEEQEAEEIQLRTSSYASAFQWNIGMVNEQFLFTLPIFLFWDALAMMLLGMALYKMGILQGDRSPQFYRCLMWGSLAAALLINGWEVWRAIQSNFALLDTFPQMRWTYQFGRLALAAFWFALLMNFIKGGVFTALRQRLANVGRMALTNYLSQSLIGLILFTGAGFGLVGQFGLAELYLVVIAVWLLQLWLSTWWLGRYRFGPVEWLWRGLTYNKFPENARD